MSDSLMIPIRKLMVWQVDGWKKYICNERHLKLRSHCDQLLITSENKILESISTKGKIKGIYKEDVLVLFINQKSLIRKVKFQIELNSSQYYGELSKFFPIVSHNSKEFKNEVIPIYRNVDDVISHALDKNDTSTSSDLPPSFKNFVKLCLLDPSFPSFVQEVQNIVNSATDK